MDAIIRKDQRKLPPKNIFALSFSCFYPGILPAAGDASSEKIKEQAYPCELYSRISEKWDHRRESAAEDKKEAARKQSAPGFAVNNTERRKQLQAIAISPIPDLRRWSCKRRKASAWKGANSRGSLCPFRVSDPSIRECRKNRSLRDWQRDLKKALRQASTEDWRNNLSGLWRGGVKKPVKGILFARYWLSDVIWIKSANPFSTTVFSRPWFYPAMIFSGFCCRTICSGYPRRFVRVLHCSRGIFQQYFLSFPWFFIGLFYFRIEQDFKPSGANNGRDADFWTVIFNI